MNILDLDHFDSDCLNFDKIHCLLDNRHYFDFDYYSYFDNFDYYFGN